MSELAFWAENAPFGLKIPGDLVESILIHCREAGAIETGGILVGEYTESHDCAVVQQVTGPTTDSRGSRTRFQRGVEGLQEILDRLWRRQRGYYLGEWHFHPGGASEPSSVDHRQLRSIARDPAYSCPEPVLLIIGGDPSVDWTVSAFVFPEGDAATPLRSQG